MSTPDKRPPEPEHERTPIEKMRALTHAIVSVPKSELGKKRKRAKTKKKRPH